MTNRLPFYMPGDHGPPDEPDWPNDEEIQQIVRAHEGDELDVYDISRKYDYSIETITQILGIDHTADSDIT